jgi:hypothetical protein
MLREILSMPNSKRFRGSLVAFAFLTTALRADGPAEPLRLMPADVDLVLSVPNARQLAQTVTALELLQKLEAFSAYREALDSTHARRIRQFLAYFEKETGAPWPRSLDQVAGGGIVLGVKIGKDPAPTLLIIQGRDEKQQQEFAGLAFRLLEQELSRQDEKVKVVRRAYQGIEILHVDEKLMAAVAGSAILVSNQEKLLQSAIDLYRERKGKSCADIASIAAGAKLLPRDALATLWLNLETVRKDPNAAAAFKTAPRDDPIQTILFGGYLDIVGRSTFLAAALVREGDDFLVTVRMPKGRNGMGADSALHVPPATSSASRPLLLPKGVLFSTSFYLDVSRIWRDRDKLFPDKVARSIETADKNTSPFLVGLKISRVLPEVGARHRFVAAHQADAAYQAEGGLSIPAFALVSELREPELFGKTMEATLRGAALLAGFKVKLKLVEEKVGDITLVGYRFAAEQPGVDESVGSILRFYSPCFARVGDQFLWCSTLELGRELVVALQNEKKCASTGAVKSRFFATGAADYLQSIEEQFVTQNVLDRALPVADAAAEIKALLSLLRSIGPLDVEVRYDEERFSYDLRLKGLR